MGRKNKKETAAAEVWSDLKGKWVPYAEPVLKTEPQELKFKLIVPRDIMDKISWWMHRTDKEVSGFGSLDFNEKTSTFKVRDAILLKQEVGPASAEIDPAAMAKAMYRMREEKNGLKWHWHSHVNMPVFWSGDDMEIIRSLGQRGWILATVFNYQDEKKTAYFTQTKVPNPLGGEPIAHDIFINDIETDVINFVEEPLYSVWNKEYDENVTEEKGWNSMSDMYANTGVIPPRLDADERELNEARFNADDKKLEYDENGYAMAASLSRGIVYNPCFDKELKSETEQMLMIDEMLPDEIDFLERTSPSFQQLIKKYMVRIANGADEQSKLPFGILV